RPAQPARGHPVSPGADDADRRRRGRRQRPGHGRRARWRLRAHLRRAAPSRLAALPESRDGLGDPGVPGPVVEGGIPMAQSGTPAGVTAAARERMIIDGQEADAVGGETFATVNPATGATLA